MLMNLNSQYEWQSGESEMSATLICEPERIEATGTTYTYALPKVSGYGQVKDILVMAKVHKVMTVGSTQVGVVLKTTWSGRLRFVAS